MWLLSRLFRLFRVGLIYLMWGGLVGGVTHVVVPVVYALGLSSENEDIFTQRALHRVARIWLRGVLAMRVMELSLHGVERLKQPGPLMLVANHPTALDATLMVALLPQIDMVVEVSWAETPVVRRAVARSGYMRNDSGRAVVEEGVRRLRSGRRLLIFPEGSRSPAGGLHPFHRGAAWIALASGCDPVPVVIRCSPPVGLKGKAWYDIPRETPKVSITVGEAMAIGDLVEDGDSRGVAARKVNRDLRQHFLRELSYADA